MLKSLKRKPGLENNPQNIHDIAMSFLFAIFINHSVFAYNPALTTSFYRLPSSNFPSGEANILDLKKSLVRKERDSRFLAEKNGVKKWISDNGFATDVTVSKYVTHQRLGKRYQIIEAVGGLISVVEPNKSSKELFSASDLNPEIKDLGIALTLVNTGIRSSPAWNANVLTVVPDNTRLEILDFHDNWILVAHQNLKGYVDFGRVLMKTDFASFVLSSKNTWMQVLHREGSKLILRDGRKIDINKSTFVLTRPDLAIATKELPDLKANIRSHFNFTKNSADSWNVSQFRNHGLVYWKEPPPPPVDVLSTDEVLKLEITSMSFHPFDSKQALISASGIYYTYDGFTWKKINKFANQNMPVLISDTGDWFIGNYKAERNTLDFQPFFRVESLTHQIEKNIKSEVKSLKITQIESADKSRVKIKVDAGSKKYSATGLWADGKIQSWILQ